MHYHTKSRAPPRRQSLLKAGSMTKIMHKRRDKQMVKKICKYCGNEYEVPIYGDLSPNVCHRPRCVRKAMEDA